jgi:hypothetical protein
MSQTTVEDMPKGLEGQLADSGNHDILSRTNSAKQINRVTVDTLDNTQTWTATINGTAFDFLSDADTTRAEVVDGLVAAINLGAEPVTAIDEGDTLRLVSDVTGDAFTIVVSVTGATGIISQAEIVANDHSEGFGLLVVQDAFQDDGAVPPVAQSDILNNKRNIVGITKHTHNNEQAIQGGVNPGYLTTKTMDTVRSARVLVRVEEAVTPASVPHVRFLSGVGGTTLGAFRASVDTNTAEPLPDEFRFIDSAGAGELATLEIKLS